MWVGLPLWCLVCLTKVLTCFNINRSKIQWRLGDLFKLYLINTAQGWHNHKEHKVRINSVTRRGTHNTLLTPYNFQLELTFTIKWGIQQLRGVVDPRGEKWYDCCGVYICPDLAGAWSNCLLITRHSPDIHRDTAGQFLRKFQNWSWRIVSQMHWAMQ